MTLPADNFTKPAPAIGERTFVDTLLDEQRELTAAEAFARSHERHELTEPHYRKLLPASAPRPGEQYAFEVDLDQCSGCKACVTACHSLNGLDDGESWREVGALFGEALVPDESSRRGKEADSAMLAGNPPPHLGGYGGNRVVPLHQTVTTACHHCVEPGCLLGCPVLAYDKDPLTGIVRHLDDQCIGCSYCILKCPYDVPKYSAKRGIVRKCDMCHGRLAAGEAPACVQACPNEAIRISVVSLAEVTATSRSVSGGAGEKVGKRKSVTASSSLAHSLTFPPAPTWLPDSPSPRITLPTTRYVTRKPTADLRAADHSLPLPQAAHWPLILMLVLTQAGIGGLLAARFISAKSLPLELISLTFLFAGLTASVFHLGQPLKAWRIWLGWRTSWLSREAIALNAFAGAAVLCVAARWLPALTTHYSLLTFPVLALTLAAVFAQSMVYADTHRTFWSLRHTAPRFFGTVLVLSLALALVLQPTAPISIALLLATLFKLACELAVLKHADTDSDRWTQLRRTATLQTGVLRPVLAVRLLTALVGGVFIPFTIATGAVSASLAVSAFVLCLIGELAERHLFFTSVAPDKMPV
ncbi:MAG: molybdopterin oxidoreductase [Pedosphaera sp.]|nr:molybdopterin oxidoreductase [Pedosphaera sp.]